jgi:nicotinate-nucleotide adenylyltransferase
VRLGVLGGSFDPVHRGHLAVARAAIHRLTLDRLLVILSKRSPLKGQKPAPARHRLAMLRLAFKGMPRVRLSTLELRRPAPSYMVDTLRSLKRRWPEAELFLILGADAFRDLDQWRRPGEIRRLATLAVFPRPGHRIPAGVTRIPMTPVAVSASAIREGLAEGRRPKGCPREVADYARMRGLYGPSAAPFFFRG